MLFDDPQSRAVDVEIVDRDNSEDPYIPRHTVKDVRRRRSDGSGRRSGGKRGG